MKNLIKTFLVLAFFTAFAFGISVEIQKVGGKCNDKDCSDWCKSIGFLYGLCSPYGTCVCDAILDLND